MDIGEILGFSILFIIMAFLYIGTYILENWEIKDEDTEN